MSNKRYYWLKLNEDFFEDDTISWIEEQENGKDYVLFYLKLVLKSLADEGVLVRYVGERLIPYDVKALSRLTDTSTDTVKIAMRLFLEIGLISQMDSGEIYMNQIDEMIGTETRQARLMRQKRAKVNQIKDQAKIEENHVPYIESHINTSRYGGNYYDVFNRDNQQCASCKSKSNLCVHHIIGFDEADPKTTQMGSMITLCRSCHSKEHTKPKSVVTKTLLKKINFNFDLYDRIDNICDNQGKSNNVTKSYSGVNKGYTEIEIEKELEIDKETELQQDKKENKKVGVAVADYKLVNNFYQDNFGVLSPHIGEDLKMWVEDIGVDLVLEAMKKTIENQKNYSYAVGIMRNWAKNNIKTLEDVRAEEIAFNNKNKKRFNNSKPTKKETLPDWITNKQPGDEKLEESAADGKGLEDRLARLRDMQDEE